MKVWQINAKGTLKFFDQRGQIRSQKLFRSKADAEQYAPRFRVTATSDIGDLDFSSLKDDASLTISYHELRVVSWWDTISMRVERLWKRLWQ